MACLATATQADVYRMTYELNLARTGRTLQSRFIGQGNAPTCRDLCSRTASCMAYTSKKNVTSAPTPNCFLYRSADGTFADTQSISGQQDPTYYPLPQGMMNKVTLLGGSRRAHLTVRGPPGTLPRGVPEEAGVYRLHLQPAQIHRFG